MGRASRQEDTNRCRMIRARRRRATRLPLSDIHPVSGLISRLLDPQHGERIEIVYADALRRSGPVGVDIATVAFMLGDSCDCSRSGDGSTCLVDSAAVVRG